MSAPLPRSVSDLALSPVLIGIERNLALLRDNEDLELALAIELNDDDSIYRTASDRARRVRTAAVSYVDLHGWAVTPTADLQGLAVTHGEYTVSIMFGRTLADYIERGFGGHSITRTSLSLVSWKAPC